jgi:hypothetical protein
MTQPDEAVYEMMWDCRYCGQKKLLGLSHRHCPNCGAPQDPDKRYFPPENEKIAVKDHPFVGADLSCHSCNQLMSRAVKCCPHCGAPVGAGTDVRRVADVVVPDPNAPPGFQAGVAAAPAPTKSSSTIFIVLGLLGALVVVGILVAVLWKKDGAYVVAGRSWERDIAIERYDTARQSAWCDSPPTGGKEVARHKEQRGTDKVQDGQTCQTRKKDQGNGTYKEVKECTPKYKDQPVMADKCDYDVTQWKTSRTASEHGADDAPRWPQTALVHTGTCLGCEREGTRTEKYTVDFVDAKGGKTGSCDLPEAKWSSFTKGGRYKGQSRVLTGGIDCDGLVRQ